MFIYYKYLGGLNINDDGKFTSIASDILKQLATKVRMLAKNTAIAFVKSPHF